MKKVFMVITTSHHVNKPKVRTIFHTTKLGTKKESKDFIKESKFFDKAHTYFNYRYNYYIFEGLVITKEKINEIITNSNVQ